MSDTATLAELIERERIELIQIHAMVRCLNDVLLYTDDDNASMHADVAVVIARLLNESVMRLEKVRTRVAQLEKAAAAEESSAATPNKVREVRASYGASVRNSTTDYPRRSDEPEPWLMVRDCSNDARTGDYSCKPSSENWVS